MKLHQGQAVALLSGVALVAPLAAWVAHGVWGLALQPQTLWLWLWSLAIAPLIEETIFRPLLQRGLQLRLAGAAVPAAGHGANAICALAFAAVHAPAHGWQAVLWVVPSLAVGEAWRLTGRLLPCVALHAWFNLCLAVVSMAAARSGTG